MILSGTPGDDTLYGGDDGDTIHGGQGDDHLFDGDGNDSIHGDEGDDTVYPGDGDDAVFGGEGDDFIWDFDEGFGVDTIDGGPGSDTVYYSAQFKLVIVLAGANPSTIFDGGTPMATVVNVENVSVDGNSADDITGDSFDNRLDGGRGNDRLTGKDGNDDLLGVNQNDRLFGGKGDDTLSGGNDNDTLGGGPGKDTFVFEGAKPKQEHADLVLDFHKDKIGLGAQDFAKLNDHGKLKAKYFSRGDAKDGNDFINYDKESGELAYDKDGSGGVAPHVFFTLKGAPHLDAGDIIILA